MPYITKYIPNSITCINLIAGCTAIIFASHGLQQYGNLYAWQCAAIAIAIAAVADFLDGFAARLLKAYSDLGKELDSLCDLVSFGVAPAMIIFNILAENPSVPLRAPWCALIIPVAGALRLAKFNIDTRQSSSFIGLPIPANAIFWIGFASLAVNYRFAGNPAFFIPIMILEAWLMVSPVKLFSLKFKNWQFRGNEARYLLILAAIVFVACLGLSGLLWLILFYIAIAQFPFAKNLDRK